MVGENPQEDAIVLTPTGVRKPSGDSGLSSHTQQKADNPWRSANPGCNLVPHPNRAYAMDEVLRRLRVALADRYTVDRQIGRGGMSIVYLAKDLNNKRNVALKVLRPELTKSMGANRFLSEIRIVANLEHPHILPLFDSGEADGMLYFAMPLVEGESLRDRLKREGALPLDDALQITAQVCEALGYAHDHNVVHRDIKPENILIASGIARVADFGIARARTEAGDFVSTTDANIAIGTPEYMSPEQAAGSDTLDARTDIYSLGCVLYEMLAGEPPFTGRTLQAIIAKHLGEKIPTLPVVRPDIPLWIVNVIEKALAKVPADRYQTASDLVSALALGAAGEHPPRPPYRKWVARVAPVVLVVLAVLVWRFWPEPLPLDLNRIVAFPFEVSGTRGEEEPDGDLIAYHIVQALDQLGGVRWVEGRDLLEPQYRENPRLVTEQMLRQNAQAQLAGYFLDGTVLYRGDSARVILALYSTEDEALVERVDTSDVRRETEHVAYRAVASALLSMIPDAGRLGVAAVAGRSHEAIQPFARAEREFYYGRYRQAFEYYRSAVEADSGFALAAVKGAQAASWMHEQGSATELVRVALDHVETLPPLWAHFARGFEAYLTGRADTAVFYFEQAIELDGEWPEGWMGLGETYEHMLPRRTPQDSLAKNAFQMVYARTEGYAPALYHLAEFAIRERDFDRASDLLEEYRAVQPDSTVLGNLELALSCSRETADAIDWQRHMTEDVNRVFQAGKLLGVGGAQPECAIEAWRAVLRYDDTPAPSRWAYTALVGLQSMLIATGRTEELRCLLDSAAATGSRSGAAGRLHYILDALAGADVEADARAVVSSLRESPDTLTITQHWYLGLWDAYHGERAAAEVVIDLLRNRSDVYWREGALMALGLSAHVALSSADTAAALQILLEITPNASHSIYLQRAFESLGLERLVYAKLLLARGMYAEADAVAAVFDSPGAASLIFPVFLPASLQLRLVAGRAIGDAELVERMRERLTALGRDDLLDSG
jgi:serine/threonine-protein kinase